MNNQTNTTSTAGAPVPGRQPYAWVQKFYGAQPVDELDLCRDTLRTVWLSLHTDGGWLGENEIQSIRNVLSSVLDGLDDLRDVVERASEDRP